MGCKTFLGLIVEFQRRPSGFQGDVPVGRRVKSAATLMLLEEGTWALVVPSD